MDDQWNEPLDAGASGQDDDPLAVVRGLFDDFRDHIAGYLLSGLAASAAIGVAVVALGVMVFGLVAPGLVMDDEGLIQIGAGIGVSVYVVGVFVLSLAVVPMMQASLIRAVDSQRVGTAQVSFASAFDTLARKGGKIVVFYLLITVLGFIGALMCFLPALVVSALSLFAFPILVLEDVGPVEALRLAFRHMVAQPVWHLVVWVVATALIMVLNATGIGALFYLPLLAGYQVFAYRSAYGESGALGSFAA